MDPAKRTLKQVNIESAAEADHLFFYADGRWSCSSQRVYREECQVR